VGIWPLAVIWPNRPRSAAKISGQSSLAFGHGHLAKTAKKLLRFLEKLGYNTALLNKIPNKSERISAHLKKCSNFKIMHPEKYNEFFGSDETINLNSRDLEQREETNDVSDWNRLVSEWENLLLREEVDDLLSTDSDDDEFEINELLLNQTHPALDNVAKWQITDIFVENLEIPFFIED
ncbi:20150_t:CDS:2, partial [Entrophospora sp. SA101]